MEINADIIERAAVSFMWILSDAAAATANGRRSPQVSMSPVSSIHIKDLPPWKLKNPVGS